jgi:hypothetical protein
MLINQSKRAVRRWLLPSLQTARLSSGADGGSQQQQERQRREEQEKIDFGRS